MEEDFKIPMEAFSDSYESQIMETGDNDNIIESESIISESDAEAAARAYLGDAYADETQEDDKNNITVEDDDNPDEVGSEEDDDEGGENDDESNSSSNLYSSLAGVIHEQGLLPSFDINKLDIKNIDDLARTLRSEQENQAKILYEQYIANLDVDKIGKPVLELRNLNEVNADYLADNLDYAKDILRQDYRDQGFDDSRIERIINRLIDLGEEDLIDESLKAKNSLVQKNAKIIEDEKQRQFKERADAEKQQARVQEEIKKKVFDTEFIEGFNPTRTFREKMYNTMTTIVGEDDNGNPENAFMRARREDIVGFETRMYTFFELTNGFTDFSKLTAPSKSKAVQELEKAARGTIVKNNSTPAYINDKDSYFGQGDFTLNV